MSMTKKDFIGLADAIRSANGGIMHPSVPTLFTYDHLGIIAEYLASQNPAFNQAHWIEYASGEVNKKSPQK